MTEEIYTGGGFIPSFPSPAPSIHSTTSASTATPSLLPRQRNYPLKAGSMKETGVINHLDLCLLGVNRRHAKKFSRVYEGESWDRDGQGEGEGQGGERGYESFKEMGRDIEGLIDVVWVSGTPSLQIPYTISLAVLTNSSLPDYPFAPTSTFRLLRKLDSVFASLLLGEDAESGAPLTGFENRKNIVSMTEKVRIKSVAEACRMVVMEVRGRDESDDDDDDDDGACEDEGDGDDGDEEEEEMVDVIGNGNASAAANTNGNGNANVIEYRVTPGRWEMEAATVYERTIQILGDELGSQGFGEDITDGCQVST